ncbi:hypothetical protein I4F81_011280 [Pyropia yezoensis]|uniref:Uncharacterized protein n=1 Tax=Pyropia yezoensis TaxID=2788 RepID=A0ACC3CGA5_PYRYE|nr:hypothetical protein I4F81_011280 [Neopyropia yezoensis]
MVSQCPSAAVGGDLGWFRRGVMAPPFDEAVFSSAAGAVVKVHSAYGWHLVQGPFEAGTLLDPARPVLVLCHRGVRAAKAADFFLQRGYKYARVVRGGVDRYARVVDPSVPLYTK